VLGEPIWGNPGLYFQVGFCPEQDAFYERMTGLEWVTALVRLNGLDEQEADAAARRALETVDLMDAAGKKIGAYSKGMRQRVKLAQAIVHDPELLILDEPLSGMDPLARRKHDPPDPRLGPRRQERHRLEPHPARDRVDDLQHPAHQQRAHPRRGDVHHIRDLIDEHPHTVHVAPTTRARSRGRSSRTTTCGACVRGGGGVVETGKPTCSTRV
jgi:ABC-2 type transport system ATP-binding protein